MSTQETRTFKMHPKLLLDVIQRQAGSLAKAILEGVMNAADAKATFVHITLTADNLLIKDNGTGFADREAITRFFEVFGQPHAKSEDKTYGTFRMGRGQIFSFGKNLWKTGTFRMDVDIKERGLDYQLSESPVNAPGCAIRVSLYKALLPSELAETRRQIEKWCKWAPIAVYFNDAKISCDPAAAEWDHVTDEAYIRLTRTGDLAVYNLGVHTCSISNWTYGTGGEVVSRKQLKVNFARNDIQSDCAVWRKVKPFIQTQAAAANVKRAVLTDDERANLAQQLALGELPPGTDARKLKLFTAVTGRHYSADEVMSNWRYKCYTAAEEGDRRGDTLMKQGVAFVFATETLQRFGCADVPKLLALIKTLDKYNSWKPKYKDFGALTRKMDTTHTLLGDSELTPLEKVWLQALGSMRWQARDVVPGNLHGAALSAAADKACERVDRRVLIGESETALGWTDGSTYIAFSRTFLKRLEMDTYGLIQAAAVLIHELCHDTEDLASHAHDQAFYELYHEMTHDCLAEMVRRGLLAVAKAAETGQRKLTQKQLRAADQAARAQQAVTQLKQVAADTAGK